ncbi:MAG TPA: sensor histidine kinase [Desulfomicrobium sp.]|nr:sensor histidine kinase [Desulfomicrobium sp.]
MTTRLPFSRRIVIAFVLMTMVVSGSFSLGIVAVVHFVEDQLISKELRGKLNMVLHEDIRAGREPRLDARTRFFASNSAGHPIPERFADFPEGFTEIEEEDEASYVYVLEANGARYMLLQDQREFEDREEILFSVVVAGFLLCIVLSWGLGVVMARQVMAPVARLAGQVRHPDQLDTRTAPLAPSYAHDEIGHLAAAFDKTLGQLRRSIERERLFTSDVSHELRTPLMVISTSCELLLENEPHDAQREQIERIARAARDMNDLVRTFLMLARSGLDDAAETATLAEVAREQAELWGPALRAKGLDFELVDEGADTAGHNPTFLRTVMANLMRNALHYTAIGTVRLVLERDGFCIEDTGMGVPAHERDRIFEPFVRGTAARGEGLGLGLSLVKRICEHTGWDIAAKSGQEEGTCFKISFAPAHAPDQPRGSNP